MEGVNHRIRPAIIPFQALHGQPAPNVAYVLQSVEIDQARVTREHDIADDARQAEQKRKADEPRCRGAS